MKKPGKLLIACLFSFFLLLSFHSTALAVSSQGQHIIIPDKLREWDNGAKVTAVSKGSRENYHVNVSANTNGLKKGYYSIYLYDISERNLDPYDGICFNFKNLTDADIKINLTLTINSQTSIAMTDSSYAILESADQNLKESVFPAYGTILIPARFDGTVYIPFSRLYTTKGKNILPEHIQSWGITAVMTQNEQIQYEFGNIKFLCESIASMKNYNLITVSGKDQVAIPSNGSALTFYQSTVKDLNGNPLKKRAMFYLKKSSPGVTISKDGRLEVNSSCTAQKITICSKVANCVNWGELTVPLERKGITSALDNGIPQPSNVQKITTTADVKINQSICWIQIIFGTIVLFLGAIFYEWFSEYSTNYTKIKNELYHSDNYKKEDRQ